MRGPATLRGDEPAGKNCFGRVTIRALVIHLPERGPRSVDLGLFQLTAAG